MNISKYIKREDVLVMIGNLSGGGDKIAKILRDIVTLFKDVRAIKQSTEQRFTRILKELDITRLKRQINSKADMNKTQANFDAYDGRLIALADLLEQLKKELDSAKKLKKTVNAIIAIMTKDQANALATTSNVP